MSGRLEQRARWASTATCEGKEQFASFALADGIAKKRSRRGKRGHVYRCGTCHCFHIGSTTGRRRRDEIDMEETEA